MLPGHVASNSALKCHNILKLSSQVPWSPTRARCLPSHTLLYDSLIGNCCSSWSFNFFGSHGWIGLEYLFCPISNPNFGSLLILHLTCASTCMTFWNGNNLKIQRHMIRKLKIQRQMVVQSENSMDTWAKNLNDTYMCNLKTVHKYHECRAAKKFLCINFPFTL